MALHYPSLFGDFSEPPVEREAVKTQQKKKAGRPRKVVVQKVDDIIDDDDVVDEQEYLEMKQQHVASEPVSIPKKVKKQRTKLTEDEKALQYTDRKAYMALLRSMRSSNK